MLTILSLSYYGGIALAVAGVFVLLADVSVAERVLGHDSQRSEKAVSFFDRSLITGLSAALVSVVMAWELTQFNIY